MTKKYTIKDIAEMSGVSKGTVDRVLHKRGKVSPEALKRVTKILEEIDFKPNPIAKHLKNNKLYRLAVLFPNPNKDPYWLPCLDAIADFESYYKSLGIKTEVQQYDPTSPKSFTLKAKELINSAPDALLVAPIFFSEAQEVSKMCLNKGIIISTFNNIIEKEDVSNYIGQDLFQSGRTAAKLLDTLLGSGHIAIAHIEEMVQNATYMQQKEKGFKSYFQDYKTPNYNISTISIDKDLRLKNGQTLEAFLKDKATIDGIFVTNSKTFTIAQFKKAKQLKIVGYDLVPQNIDFLKTGHIDFLINQNPKEQAYIGLSTLAEHLLFEKEIPKRMLIPIDIINSENYEQYLV